MTDETIRPDHAPSPPIRVLVIEGSPTLRLMIGGLLRRWGFEPDEGGAPGRPYGLMIAEPSSADPAQDALRQATRAAGVPWLAVLPSGASGSAADADGWVQKPIAAAALHDAIRLCMDRRGRHEAGGIDLDAVAGLWGSAQDATFRRVAAVFIGEMEVRLTAIARALERHDRDGLLVEAHSVASAAANVGCAALERAARVLEAEAPAGPISRVGPLAAAVRDCAGRDLAALARLIAPG